MLLLATHLPLPLLPSLPESLPLCLLLSPPALLLHRPPQGRSHPLLHRCSPGHASHHCDSLDRHLPSDRCMRIGREERPTESDRRGDQHTHRTHCTHRQVHFPSANTTQAQPRRVSSHRRQPLAGGWSLRAGGETMEEPKDKIAEEWEKTDKQVRRKLAHSMPQRCQAVIDADGWHTDY